MTVAYVLCGGSTKPNQAPALNKPGMHGYLAWAIEAGPKLRDAGYTRLMLHNPGGLFTKGWCPNLDDLYGPEFKRVLKEGWADWREMWVDQWLLAESACLRSANRKDFALAVELLRHRYGLKEIICYVGSPTTLSEPLKDGRPCLEPMLLPGVSFAFDATYAFSDGDPICELFDWLRGEGHKVYVEPRLSTHAPKEAKGQAKHIDGTIAMDDYDASRKVNYKAEAVYGEVLLIADRGTKAPEGVTLIERLPRNDMIKGVPNNWTPEDWHLAGGKR